jgi:uncharacterized surface protein with fasciclin (FAS1) repeats
MQRRLTTLVTALKAAGLVETLKGPGPFTVFAPTDAAFAKLPKGTVEDLLKPENKAKLTAILTYHVVPGNIMSDDLEAQYTGPGLPQVVPPYTPGVVPHRQTPLKTLEGSELVVDATRGTPLLLISYLPGTGGEGKVPGIKLEAKVEPTEMVASNGVIHVIDTVLMPNK